MRLSIPAFSFVLILALTSSVLLAETVEEKYPSGKIAKRYYTNTTNKKAGTYQEFYENGYTKVKATYADDLLTGLYTEFDETGKKTLEIQYTKGLKNGIVRGYEKGVLVKDELWINGIFAFPKSQAQIKRSLAEIAKFKTEFVEEWPAGFDTARFTKEVEADNIAGLQRLREYRYLCDVAYDNMTINRKYVAHNLDAVIILNKINRLDHTPQNPGLPEDTYKSGYTGTSSSNLAMTSRGSSGVAAINMFMDDSDKSNISRVGHRRWCINPKMAATGFGSQSSFTSMWSFDTTRKDVPDYDFVCFPPKGYIPTTYFKKHYAWSISLNPALYSKPNKDSIKISVSEWKAPKPVELKISYQNIDFSGIAINNCIIFLPEGINVSPKSRYFVSISGIKTKAGEDTKIEYFVEFF